MSIKHLEWLGITYDGWKKKEERVYENLSLAELYQTLRT